MGGVKRMVLLGTIGRYGVEAKYNNGGTPCASFMRIVSEMGTDGKSHETYVPCEVWGKKVEAAGEFDAGVLVLFKDRLRERQKGEGQWELSVSGFELTPILTPTPVLTGRNEEERHGKTYPDPAHLCDEPRAGIFTERELQMQLGFPWLQWLIALTKELIDNGLDARETAGVSPEITVALDGATLTVDDNGPGLPQATIERSLDYLVRVSDKAHYVSPSRGQLGNALKCVWAAPYVMSRDRVGRVEVETGGRQYQVDVQLEQLAQQPQVSLTIHATEKIKRAPR